MGDSGDRSSAVLSAPGLLLRFDHVGRLVAAGSSATPDEPWLRRSGDVTVAGNDVPADLAEPVVSVGADEVEVVRTVAGAQTTVRHTVDSESWNVRVVLANDTDAERVLTDVRLGWRPGPGMVVTALGAGAEAAYAVQRADGTGSVLVGRLRSGAQPGVDERSLLLGSLVLRPGHRWAASWRWTVVPDAAHAVTTDDLPAATWLDLGQTVLLPAGPDVAVVAPDLDVEVGEQRIEVRSERPGSWPVELRSVRGTTVHDLTWAPGLDDLVDAAAAAALAGPTSPGGTARLRAAPAGLLVQDALARHGLEDADAGVDALELLAGLLVERVDEDPGGADPLTLAFLAREANRTAGTAVLDAATRGLLGVAAPAPGLGLAGLGIALALVHADRSAVAVGERLALLLEAADPTTGAGLELALLLGARPEGEPGRSSAGLRRLGAALGAGLPGRVLPAAEPDVLAYGATLLGLVDERAGQRLAGVWGVSAAELARRAAAQARARTDARSAGGHRLDAQDERALAWLVLGRAPR